MAKLSLPEKAQLAKLAAGDFNQYVDWGRKECPNQQTYEISYSPNPDFSELRIEAMKKMLTPSTPLEKVAFDTRRINQEKERNPRGNLQHWQRSAPFVENKDQERLDKFAKVFNAVKGLKEQLEGQPEWFDSFTRLLYDTLHRTLRTKQGNVEVFPPQLSYVEQLLFNRYRLSMDDLQALSKYELQEKILTKDDSLMKRATTLRETGKAPTKLDSFSEEITKKDGDDVNEGMVKGIIENLFSKIEKKESSKTVERTITITIRDQEV